MGVFDWSDKVNTVFGRKHNIEEGNKKMYSLFPEQCKMSLKTKLKITKGHNKSHKSQAGIKLLEIIRSVIFGMESQLKVTCSMMKANKFLYTFYQRRRTTNNDYIKKFEAYIKFIESYRGKTPIQHVLVKSKITNMLIYNTNNPTP